jgi:transposase InsO family protein
MKPLAEALGVARSNLIVQRKLAARRRCGFAPRPDDEWLLPLIRAIVAERASYGYRRVTALLNRQLEAEGRARVNHKRIYRIMRMNDLLLPRYSGRRERTHEGVVVTLKSNLRWCSDVFTIRCWNGEAIQVLFSFDCCDREAMGWLATSAGVSGEMVRDLMSETVEYRFGPAALGARIQSSGCRTTVPVTPRARPASSRAHWACWSAPRRPTRPSPMASRRPSSKPSSATTSI